MERQEIINFLRRKPGYIKKGSKYLATRLEADVNDVLYAKSYLASEERVDRFSGIENENENDLGLPPGKQDQSLEEYCISVGLDPEKVDKYNHVKYWTDGAGNRRYSIVPKNEPDIDYAEEFIQTISEYAPPDRASLFNKIEEPKERIAILNLFDAHIDKVSYISRTDEESTVEDNILTFITAFLDLLESVKSKEPEEIVFVVGNDFWHTNGSSNQTKSGTYVGDVVEMSNEDSFRIGLNLIMQCIDFAREIAPVRIVFIKGNHDHDKVMYLLECLRVFYQNQSDVTVVDSRKSRQYIRYGEWLFGFTHGDNQTKAADLPSLMSTDKESREHWSDVKQGIYFLGHIHHEKRQDFRGCSVMYLRSVSKSDNWHWEKGFTAVPKTAYAFIYDKDGKREYEFKVNI